MKNQIKNKNTYTKEKLIREIAAKTRISTVNIREMYNALEQIIEDKLSSATIDTDVSIRLFEGVTIDSSFVPEKEKVNNLTGETITTIPKIKPKANVTRYYCERLSKNIK